MIAGIILVAGCVFVLRRPSSVGSPTFWAEDGTIYFKDAIERGWAALLEPYAGQLFLLQRTVANVVSSLPVLIQPGLYAAVAIVVAVTSSSLVLSSRWRHPVPFIARVVCLVALLCSPQVNDVLATLVNAHWWLGVGLLVLGMLKDPMSRLAQAGEIAFALVAALSGFAALYALPILSVRAIRERSRQSLAVLSVVVAGLLAQTPSLLASGRRGDIMAIASDFTMALEIFVRRVVGSALFGPANVWDLAALNWLIVILIGLLSVALAKLWYDLLKQQAVRLEAVALLTTVIAGWFFAMWAVTQPGGALEMLLWPGAANRYFLISNAAIYLTLLLRLSLLRVEPTVSTLSKAALGVASLLLAIGIASGYRLSPIGSPDWASFAECVDEGRPRCVTVIPPAWTLEVHPPQ